MCARVILYPELQFQMPNALCLKNISSISYIFFTFHMSSHNNEETLAQAAFKYMSYVLWCRSVDKKDIPCLCEYVIFHYEQHFHIPNAFCLKNYDFKCQTFFHFSFGSYQQWVSIFSCNRQSVSAQLAPSHYLNQRWPISLNPIRATGFQCVIPSGLCLGPLLLTWINFNPSMDK